MPFAVTVSNPNLFSRVRLTDLAAPQIKVAAFMLTSSTSAPTFATSM